MNDFMKPVYGFQQVHPGEFCVVFFDEADKMRLRKKDSELTFCPQQSFLMLLESDGPYDINMEYNTSESLYINTNLILFVFGGAITGIEKTVADRLASEKRGFTPVTSSFFAEAEGAALRKKVTIDDLVAYGMLSEFCGRIGEIIYMHPVDETSLRKILCEGEVCLEKQLINVMPKGCRYELDESAVAHVVKEALQAPLGVRGLGNALAPTASQALSIMRENPQITHITVWYDDVSGDFVLNEGCLEDDASIVPTPNDYEHIEELNEMD